jgi:tRNA-modifying protein YgfZ
MDRLPVALPPADLDQLLRTDAMWFDRSARGRTLIDGAQGRAMLGGLVSNDVASLAPGHGQYAAAPTPKGKLLADPRIFCLTDTTLLCDVPERAASAWRDMLRKFLPPRLAKHRDAGHELQCLGVYGPAATAQAALATGIDAAVLDALPPYGVARTSDDLRATLVVRSLDIGGVGFDLFGSPSVVDSLREAAVARGRLGTDELWHAARVRAGRPEWGVDMDDSTIPQEANFDELGAISYTKGCYTGQETIARVHFRGHVNRHLRGLAGDTLAPGAVLWDGERSVGDIRSVAAGPRGGFVALAMVRREVPTGATLVWREGGDNGAQTDEGTAVVTALPYAG